MHQEKAVTRQPSTSEADLIRILARGVERGLYLILLITLLKWLGFPFPNLTAKVLVFQVLVELVAAGGLILFLTETPRQKRGAGSLRSLLQQTRGGH